MFGNTLFYTISSLLTTASLNRYCKTPKNSLCLVHGFKFRLPSSNDDSAQTTIEIGSRCLLPDQVNQDDTVSDQKNSVGCEGGNLEVKSDSVPQEEHRLREEYFQPTSLPPPPRPRPMAWIQPQLYQQGAAALLLQLNSSLMFWLGQQDVSSCGMYNTQRDSWCHFGREI